ncbi:uncharacterized protein LOC110031139 [Phalaenopsis equestris]|uniref:uncharacterized protein LOC110031139 n=1 Tax=Phalaenopsis equestris TaxID=78828 RepID=UPI0009E1A485|nr:uncharacterized protein LOC110031139 [Phalaenopsis equestris]
MSSANILMTIKDEQAVKWSQPLKPNSRNQEQYCHFHRSRDHTTEACKLLKDEIERLIQQGYLGRFIQNKLDGSDNAHTGGQQTQRQQHGSHLVVGEIQTIAGGSLLNDQVFFIIPGEPMQRKLRLKSKTFVDSDLEGVQAPHQDPLVISAGIGEPCYNVKRILIDNGSSVNVFFYSTFLCLGLTRERLQPKSGSLYSFDNQPVRIEGTINLHVVLGDFPRQITNSIQFIVIKSESAYNANFGKPLQSIFGIVTSVTHLKLKFPTSPWIGVVRGDQQITQSCYVRQAQPHTLMTLNIENFDLRDEDISQRASPMEDLVQISLSNKHPSKNSAAWFPTLQ